jgi:hypothetical protein
MRTPVVKRQTFPTSGCFHFFRWGAGGASFPSGNVCGLHGCRLGSHRACPQPFLRVERHREGGDSEQSEGARRPRNRSVPAYRPTPTPGGTLVCAREAQGWGRGSPRSPGRAGRSRDRSERRRPSTRAGAGQRASGRTRVRRRPRCQRAAHGGQAPPMGTPGGGRRASLPLGDRRRERPRLAVAPEQRAPVPGYGPRVSGPCPGRVWSPGAPNIFGPQACGGAPGRPRRTTPPGERRCRAACRQGPSASRRMPWRMGPGGTRPRHPGPGRRGRSQGSPPPARDAGACPYPGRSGARPRWGRPAAAPSAHWPPPGRVAAGRPRRAGRGPPRRLCGPRARQPAPRPQGGWSCRRCLGRARARCLGGWGAGQACIAQRVAGRDGSGADPGAPACRPGRRTRVAASRHAAAPPCSGRRSCRVSPCRRGSLAERVGPRPTGRCA